MPATPDIPEPPAAHAQPLEANTDHGDGGFLPDTDDVFSFEIPMPPEMDAQGNPTANFGYEFKVALWRQRITDANRAILREVRGYRKDEKARHEELIVTIGKLGSWWVAVWDAIKVCFSGSIDIVKVLAGNENGQLKYFALTLVALAAIANGVAFSSTLFSTEVPTKCGRGTELHDGRCEVVLPERVDP